MAPVAYGLEVSTAPSASSAWSYAWAASINSAFNGSVMPYCSPPPRTTVIRRWMAAGHKSPFAVK